MTTGRKPKPAAVKRLEGNPGKRKLGTAPEGIGQPLFPAHLLPEHRVLWFETLDAVPKGTIAKGDTAILENYVVSWQLARTMLRMIIATGYLVQSERGPVKHPLLSTLRGAQAELRASAAELGLTPVSRERLSKQADDEDEPMQWLLGGDEDPALQWATTREQ